jgi:light-regulated signal transduction histidine kinase (bacteriophytochrome)
VSAKLFAGLAILTLGFAFASSRPSVMYTPTATIVFHARHFLSTLLNALQLIDDLLNLSRLDRHEMALKMTPLNSLVENVLVDLKSESAGREIEWHVGALPSFDCDPGLMQQVFANLLSNAVKYTRRRERAVIEIGQMIVNDQVVVYVRDNGAGFDSKYADRLFGAFQRLHGTDEFEGTGVGLATVQRIIRKHGGRVWADAETGRGATFCFTLDGSSQSTQNNVSASERRSRAASANGSRN